MELVGPLTTSRRSVLKRAGLAAASFALPRRALQTQLERMQAFEEVGVA